MSAIMPEYLTHMNASQLLRPFAGRFFILEVCVGFKGRGVIRKQGEMNKLEAAYAEHLRMRMRAGEVISFAFDALKLRLAEKTFYTPDFLVLTKDLTIEIHEVKGFWEDDSRVKIKVAAAQFPFVFRAVTKNKQGWQFEELTKIEGKNE